ncbi:MAG: TRAP transporter large permease subunit [Ignavibacteria bacterium]|nr:TRAP transporter large permease subunit [Ignavibacteria bacterium]MBT8381383.1 TRAP transporter large permease subunit [Ignavibacteria bacterium]NNL21455.1 TRAP transporter large permease subunit [Ignavibacteriaceae bacterium]
MELIPILFFIVVLICLLWGYPVSFTLGGVSIIFGVIIFGTNFFNLLPLRIWGIMSNYVLIAVPLFIFMGVMLEKSGLAEELLETMALLFGKLKGGLAISVLLVGTLLGASTGIVGATVVTMGVLSLPVMLKRGYNAKAASGIIMASGTLGQIIPPSIILILLGSVLNVPVGELFIAALLPGLILVLLFFLWIVLLTITKPKSVPAMPAEELRKFKGSDAVKRIFSAFILPSILVLAVLGSIFAGFASPTEAAGIGAFGAIVLSAIKKRFSIKTLKEVMLKTTSITSMVFLILVGATAFSLVFRGVNGDRLLTQFILESNFEPYQFLAIAMLVIFILGFFIDFIEITFIIVPVIAPILVQMDFDLLWIGIIIAMNLQTSFLTPPFGFSIFYLKGVAPPGVTTAQLYKGVIPYVVLQLTALLLIIIFPEISFWLLKIFSN